MTTSLARRFVPVYRQGHTYRIYDVRLPGPVRPAIGGGLHPERALVVAFDHEGPGGVFGPRVSVHYRGKNNSPNGYGPRWTRTLSLPRWQWLGRAFRAPRRTA